MASSRNYRPRPIDVRKPMPVMRDLHLPPVPRQIDHEATDEKKGGMETGVKYTAGRPKGVRVTKVSEGAEPALFKSLFKSWKPPATPADFSMVGRSGNVAQATAQASAADLAKGMSDCSFGESEDVADDGSGKTEMFRIEDSPAARPRRPG